MKPLKIVHLPSSYLPRSVGGTEVYVHRLCEALSARGHSNTIIVHGAKAESPSSSYDVVSFSPISVKHRANLYRVSQDQELKEVETFLRTYRPHAIHFHALTLGASSDHFRLAQRLGIPYFITYHTPTLSCLRGTLLRDGSHVCEGRVEPEACASCLFQRQHIPKPLRGMLAKSPISWTRLPNSFWAKWFSMPSLVSSWKQNLDDFYGGARRVIVPAAWCREVLLKNSVAAEKMVLLRQGVPGATRTRYLKRPSSTRFTIGYLGRIAPEKGVGTVFELTQKMLVRYPHLKSDFLGPIDPSIKEWFDKKRSEIPAVSYSGVKPDGQVRSWLDSLDFLILPSRIMETGPLVLLEAWDAGIPVIGANLGGIREVLLANQLPEFLFDPFDAKSAELAFKNCLRRLEKEPLAVVIPGVDDIAQAMEKIYAE